MVRGDETRHKYLTHSEWHTDSKFVGLLKVGYQTSILEMPSTIEKLVDAAAVTARATRRTDATKRKLLASPAGGEEVQLVRDFQQGLSLSLSLLRKPPRRPSHSS